MNGGSSPVDARAAVLLPVRLETRFDTPEDCDVTRLRVLVIPDICWFDRHQEASGAELELLAQAVEQAGGPLVTGTDATPEAEAAFEMLARQVGPGRALWLARHGADQDADKRRDAPGGTRIHGLPPELVLVADVATPSGGSRRVELGRRAVIRRSFTITPDRDDPDGWWPSWDALDAAGLAFDVQLKEDDEPIDPDALACLYVVGLGDTAVEELLLPHLAAGDLGLAHQGTPTNTVTGSRAVNLHRDAASWLRLGEGGPGTEEARVAKALTGNPQALGRLVGASSGVADECASLLIHILWPALAGVLINDVWGAPPEWLTDPVGIRDHRARVAVQASAAREWAAKFLRPDGPLPILRIGEQPYGLWPVSAWRRWQEDSQPIRGTVVRIARTALPAVARRAETGLGTVVEADDIRLWELLAQTPTSNSYDARAMLEMRWLRTMLDQRTNELFEDWWREIVAAVGNVLPPEFVPSEGSEGIGGHLMSTGAPIPVPLRPVLPDPARDPRGSLSPSVEVEEDEAIYLLENDPAAWLAAALTQFEELFRESAFNGDLWNRMLDPLDAWPPSLFWRLTVVSGLIAVDHAAREASDDYPEQDPLIDRISGGISTDYYGAAVEGYERFHEAIIKLRYLCESTGDLLGVMERILAGILDTATGRVDPWLTGAAWHRLKSVDTARPVGLYGWVDRPHLGEPGPDLKTGVLLAPSDAQARTAVVLRDKSRSDPEKRWHLDLTSERVRAAVRLGDEIRVGAHPAEAVGREVERLAGDRPRIDALRAKFPLRTEHAGRRTCDGLAVLAGALRNPPDPRLVEAGLDEQDIARIRELQTTLDAYADLLVADGVHHALAGRPDAAHQSMEAAAGLGMPPPLEVLATPRSGRAVHTTVLARLPAAQAEAGARSPATIASQAFAAWLVSETGAATGPNWTWQVQTDTGQRAVRLADLGLEPADSLAIHAQLLDAMVARFAGASPGEAVTSPPGPELSRRLAATLAARVPTSADLGLGPDSAASIDGLVADELRGRLALLDVALEEIVMRLEGAATDDERAAALSEAARWGTLPAFDPDELEERLEDVLAELQDRQQLAASVDASTSVAELGRIVAQVAFGDGASLPMTATLPVTAVGTLAPEPADASGRPRIDRTWLELAAAVRPPLARIEAHQAGAVLAGRAPLSAATSHPGDPWLEAVPAPAPREDDPRLLVAYGPDLPPGSTQAAIGLIDGWAEVIPLPEHTASAAFRFNAPGSRAPQAFLLAVTPVMDEPLSVETVEAIVRDARLAAHARMARREDLANLDLLAGGLLPAFEEGGFQWGMPATMGSWG